MTPSKRLFLFLFLLCLLPLAAESSEYLLFTPRPLEGELLIPERGKGILVQRITLKRGDTLSQISRDFSGKGSYFPQILLFNNISNPDLIFAGKELLVPISKPVGAATTPPPEKRASPVHKKNLRQKNLTDMPAAGRALPARSQKSASAVKPINKEQQPGSDTAAKTGEQDSYLKAVTAFDRGDYAKALTLFNRFLERYPTSLMAADASLYKAECLLKLSAQ